MLIVYDRASGEVLDNTGTNSVIPLGPPDAKAYRNTDARGIPRESLALLRLHDERDADQVQAALHNYHRVNPDAGALVIDGPYPRLAADRDTIPADGATPAVVTYTSGRAPATVTFDVNGETITEDTADGSASIEVVADAPGPIAVTCEGMSVHIEATEAPV